MSSQRRSTRHTPSYAGHGLRTVFRRLPLVGFMAVTLAACGDDPFAVDWQARPDTALLFSLQRPELNLPSAFSFTRREPIRIEAPQATGRWDLAVDTREGRLVFSPPIVFNIASRARIAAFPDASFEDLLEAPRDTTFFSAEPVPVELGTAYVVQTSEVVRSFGQRCLFYAKLEPLSLDPELGTVEFVYDVNPTCNDRDLVPPN